MVVFLKNLDRLQMYWKAVPPPYWQLQLGTGETPAATCYGRWGTASPLQRRSHPTEHLCSIILWVPLVAKRQERPGASGSGPGPRPRSRVGGGVWERRQLIGFLVAGEPKRLISPLNRVRLGDREVVSSKPLRSVPRWLFTQRP